MKPTKFTLTEPEYRALRLKAEEADRLRRAMRKALRLYLTGNRTHWRVVLNRALARRKQ